MLAVVQVLGVANDATERDLKRAYHKLALEFHPDKVAAEQKEDAEKKFREIAEVPLAPRSERRLLCGMRTRSHICIVCTEERTGWFTGPCRRMRCCRIRSYGRSLTMARI